MTKIKSERGLRGGTREGGWNKTQEWEWVELFGCLGW